MKLNKEDIINNSTLSKREVISGVYFLINKNDEIVYVGSSADILARIKMHKMDCKKRFNRHFFIKCEKEDKQSRMDMEKYYIKKFTPKYNIVYNPDYEVVPVLRGDGKVKYMKYQKKSNN